MLVAKIIDGQVADIADYRAMFISNVFPPDGPSNEWMAEQGVKRVNLYRDHDPETQKLVSCSPVIEGDWVYTVAVEPLTAEDLAVRTAAKKADNKRIAKLKLQETDWCELSSVRDTTQPTHLTNGAAYDSYRTQLRAIAVNPPEVVQSWPVCPESVWATN